MGFYQYVQCTSVLESTPEIFLSDTAHLNPRSSNLKLEYLSTVFSWACRDLLENANTRLTQCCTWYKLYLDHLLRNQPPTQILYRISQSLLPLPPSISVTYWLLEYLQQIQRLEIKAISPCKDLNFPFIMQDIYCFGVKLSLRLVSARWVVSWSSCCWRLMIASLLDMVPPYFFFFCWVIFHQISHIWHQMWGYRCRQARGGGWRGWAHFYHQLCWKAD